MSRTARCATNDRPLLPPFYRLPVRHRAVFESIYRKIGTLIRILCGEFLVDIDAQTRRLAGMQKTFLKAVRVRIYRVGVALMAHVFLNAEIWNGQPEVQCCGHANRRQISGSMTARFDMIKIGESRHAPQMADTTGMHHRRTNVVDELLLDYI